MKKTMLLLMFLSLTFFVLACGSNKQTSLTTSEQPQSKEGEEDPAEEAAKPWFDEIKPKEIEGYVFKKENGNILVVNPSPRKIEGGKTMYDAIWFTNDPHSVEIGDRVQATYEVVETSYPAHAKTTKIKETRKPKASRG
ncbi:DUF3221 domain-containing protein [uncultured Metabacillus sp.]|uniref:DUF3221 domain-containing protein n=1 Tax=uncultured Metabacillus sp. TaxID=2860135 RepID=UPI002631A76B|nr:DUF3221 domain-containing protein [uncultured Metabacillus sp.]